MLSPQNAFAPFIGGPGLLITVNGGAVVNSLGQPISVPSTVVGLAANSTTYIFLNLTAVAIQTNTTGFVGGKTTYPISVVAANNVGITSVLDQRADISSAEPLDETLGQRLRRLADVAVNNNPLFNTPLERPPAWVNGTAYQQFSTVTNGGNQYVCSLAGTSAGSGGPSGTGVSPITDNTATWYYYGPANPATNDAFAPAVTNVTGGTTVSGLTNKYSVGNGLAGVFYFGGTGNAVTISPGANAQYQFWQTSVVSGGNGPVGTESGQAGWSVTFYTDAPKFAIGTYAGVPQIVVDGQFIQRGGFPESAAGNPSWQVVDYTSVWPPRKARRVTLISAFAVKFSGVCVDTLSNVWSPPVFDAVRCVVVGDSISSGGGTSYPSLPGGLWPAQLSLALNWFDVINCSSGGTGYIANNTGVGYSFINRLTDVTKLSPSPDIVMVFGGINDEGSGAGAIQAAALAYFQALRTALPSAVVVVLGAYPAATGPSVTRLATEAALLAAFNSWADSNSYFIPVSNDPNGSWITGTGNVGSQNGSGNSDVYTGTDGTHPTQSGGDYIAQRIATAIRNLVLPYIP